MIEFPELFKTKEKLVADLAFLESGIEAQVGDIEDALKIGGDELIKAEMEELYHIVVMTIKRKKALAKLEEELYTFKIPE